MARLIRRYIDPDELIDVPSTLTSANGMQSVLGAYLRKKLRLELGLPEGTPDEVLRQAWAEQVLPLLQMAQKDEEAPSLGAQMAKANAAYAARLEMMQSVYKSKRRSGL